jgi:hypothetical protein
MKSVNKSFEPILRSAVIKSLKHYEHANNDNFLSDLYLYYDAENQTLTFFDNIEKELFSLVLNEASVVWNLDVLQEIKDTAKYVLKGLKDERSFDRDFISKPFTVSLVDSDFVVEEELFFLDDPTAKTGGDLWSGINRELDEFFKNLMK